MKHYIEITLLPDADITLYFLWGKVYQQLHLALVANKDENGRVGIGVSFPQYEAKSFQLGSKFRLFAIHKKELELLNIQHWFVRLLDYVHITSTRDVPNKIDHYACFKRHQVKSNMERLARRKAKHEAIDLKQALDFYKGRKEVYSQAPFVRLQSLSSKEKFRLMIIQVKADTASNESCFSTYGLSAKSALPMF